MPLDEEKGECEIIMHYSPSKGRLLEIDDIDPYRINCGLRDVLCRRVLEGLGYKYYYDMSECSKARCSLKVVKK